MGAIAQRGAHFEPAAEPNVIPFIDVLLVLLIIFMVTAPRPTADFNVNLPGPNVQRIIDALPPTIVSIRSIEGGTAVYVGDETVQRSDLAAHLIGAIQNADPRLSASDAHAARIYVRADLDVPYQAVIAVMDDLNSASFRAVSILAQDGDAPS